MKRGWQIGGGKQHTCRGEGDAKEALGVSILLRRVGASERLVYLMRRQKLAEVVRDKS